MIMSNKGIKIKAKFDSKEKEYFHIKKGKDNSQYVIPKDREERDGKHISVHPSGVVNIKSKTKESYDILKKIPILKEYIKERLSNPIKISNAEFALILDYGKVKNFVDIKPQEHILDMDSYLGNCDEVIIEDDDFDFIEKYQGDLITIVVFDKNGKAFFAFKNKKGFGIPIELKD